MACSTPTTTQPLRSAHHGNPTPASTCRRQVAYGRKVLGYGITYRSSSPRRPYIILRYLGLKVQSITGPTNVAVVPSSWWLIVAAQWNEHCRG